MQRDDCSILKLVYLNGSNQLNNAKDALDILKMHTRFNLIPFDFIGYGDEMVNCVALDEYTKSGTRTERE